MTDQITTINKVCDSAKTAPDGWAVTTLGVVADIIMGQSPNGESYNQKKDGLPFYQGITEFGEKYVDIKTFTNQPTKIIEANSILFSVRAPVGKVNFTKHKACIGRGNAGLKMKNGQQLFLYYLLKINEKAFLRNTTGTVFDSISGGQLKSFEILIPKEKEEQRAIAAVLSSFDDKIELLREQNKTLEATAQAIFKEWFVNFNFPDADGKPYKDSGGKMVESELGEIPEGWRVGKLGDEFDITIGRTPPRLETEWFSDMPTGKKWISIKDLGNSEMYISNTSEYLTEEAIEKFNVPIIPPNTTILSFKMTVGKLAITTEEMLSNEAIAHFKIKEISNLDTEYIYLFLKSLDFNSLGSTSSIVTAINSTMIKALEVVVPEGQIFQKFNSVIRPIFGKLKNNNFQIQSLSTLRDTLLPKLMKGEVRVEGFHN